ncbi:MAG: RNA polymerase sigma-70 factor, ECF subfamily [Parcubacteria group bacterium Gr01-1014_18]|nr:MAG: RNA polymerase sigma-70 factor, ECF subfamily [Parcubacteria group bacterium Greene0416_36]TSC81104.1 MAG: RNA polymerase sigma-70 factor, ECF subfamily [Parcubacteria group bacterium Gr01-1014_18]TSC98480.1 MAG: RNA polymerase sigma-70 factor, ECF subfamily [Parcubacteria group bacterium Greene1014_20]TSD07355.1 MAG: RNA polymerase sigma-70 factor, ECF subfamily [Parcubacteria group bacterium Greene0714_2]
MNWQEQFDLYRVITHKDSEAFGRLYDRYIDRIYRFILGKVAAEDDARDIANDIFVKCWQYLTDSENVPVVNLNAFLYKMARNRIIDFYRRKKDLRLDDWEELPQIPDSAFDKMIENLGDRESIRKALSGLRPEYRDIIIMRYLDDLSFSDIASASGKSLVNVRVLAHRAMGALRKIFHGRI